MDKVKNSEGFWVFTSYFLSSKDDCAMHSMPWSFPTAPSFLSNNLSWLPLITGILLLSVMLAEGCVKRPNFEPSPGVSPKVHMPSEPLDGTEQLKVYSQCRYCS